jgi:hypothetical protein
MKNSIVAIHQPNFFPWLGYFNKIIKSDKFIFLDDVQFPKKGGTWSNRVKILNQGNSQWLSVPVERNYSGTRKVNEMYFSKSENWRVRVIKSIWGSYRKAPYFDKLINDIEILINNPENNLSNYNMNAIIKICKLLKIDTQKIHLSSDYSTTDVATKRLIDLTKKVGGNVYMCGGGAEEYQDDKIFLNAGVTLQYQNFQQHAYSQYKKKEFVTGLSILDAAMNLGWDGVKKLLINSN